MNVSAKVWEIILVWFDFVWLGLKTFTFHPSAYIQGISSLLARFLSLYFSLVFLHYLYVFYIIYILPTGEFSKRVWMISDQLFVTLYRLSIYHKQLRRHHPNPFRELPCIIIVIHVQFIPVWNIDMACRYMYHHGIVEISCFLPNLLLLYVDFVITVHIAYIVCIMDIRIEYYNNPGLYILKYM